jgi:hypothetical protein
MLLLVVVFAPACSAAGKWAEMQFDDKDVDDDLLGMASYKAFGQTIVAVGNNKHMAGHRLVAF